MGGDHDKHHMKVEVVNDGDLRFTKDETNRKREADLKIGAWLSAALEDPSTCQSMKDDINEWFESTFISA